MKTFRFHALSVLGLAVLPALPAATPILWNFEQDTQSGPIAIAQDAAGLCPLTQTDPVSRPERSSDVASAPPGPDNNTSSADFKRDERQFLQAADSPLLDITDSAPFTLDLWLKPRSYPEAENDSLAAMIIQKRGGTASTQQKPGYHLALNHEGLILFRAEDTDGRGKTLKANTALPLGTWSHIAVVRTADGKFTLHVNGREDALAGGPKLAGSLQNDGAFVLGANRFAQNKQFFFDGLMDNIRLTPAVLEPAGFPAK